MVSIGRGHLPPLFDGVSKRGENRYGVFPADAGISDTDTVLKTSLALFRDLLAAYVWFISIV